MQSVVITDWKDSQQLKSLNPIQKNGKRFALFQNLEGKFLRQIILKTFTELLILKIDKALWVQLFLTIDFTSAEATMVFNHQTQSKCTIQRWTSKN